MEKGVYIEDAATASAASQAAAPQASVYRFQDLEGRGPFRPGFTDRWRSDLDAGEDLPPFYVEMGVSPFAVPHLITPGFHAGVGCESREQLDRWFSKSEQLRLKALGFRMVEFTPSRIIARTPTQVFFEHATPLRWLNHGAKQ